jgi:hypothetical protein
MQVADGWLSRALRMFTLPVFGTFESTLLDFGHLTCGTKVTFSG